MAHARAPRIPAPHSVSTQAAAALALAVPRDVVLPELHDIEGWRRHIADMDAATRPLFALMSLPRPVTIERERVGACDVYKATPETVDFPAGKLMLDFHGGALVYMGGEAVGSWARLRASLLGLPIASVDYRMPPDHPFPAAVDDAVAVYRALLDSYRSHDIVVSGSSAGGNIAAALMLRLREERIAFPAGMVLLTPQLDLTESGDTFQTLLGLDRLASLLPSSRLYAGGAALDDPMVSPLFADFAAGFPPTMLQSGTRDLFLSNTVRMHRALRKQDIDAELHIWEAMPHGGFIGAPEDAEIITEIGNFLRKVWAF